MSMEKLDIINIFNIIAKKKSVPELSVLHSSEFSAPFFFFYLLKLCLLCFWDFIFLLFFF